MALGLAIGLCFVFWQPLWTGAGLVGGDLYSYFLPQKQFLAESLRAGEWPLWNHRSGFGYPLVAESQTGLFYPPHLLYSLLDFERAYIVLQLAHYILAFLGTWRLARKLTLSQTGALLVATAFVYGWFPPRICLEWAIIGGAWMPLALFWLERSLRRGRWRSLTPLSVTLAMQMLAGHFHLAFLTQLLIVAWLPLRLWFWTTGVTPALQSTRGRFLLLATGAVLLSFGLAAMQLLPTLELKQLSQRDTASGPDFNPADGHIPPLYLSQFVASWWFWYAPDVNRDQALGELTWLRYPTATNQVEAHLYLGLPPLLVLLIALSGRRSRAALWNRETLCLLLISLAAILYATGWLVPLLKHVPGFGFFRGPGRYGLLATLALALLAGRAWDVLRPCCSLRRTVFAALLLLLTAADLWIVSRVVTYAVPVQPGGLSRLDLSPVKELLASVPHARLYTPGPNLTNLLGVSSVPEYLGIGPAEYYNPALKLPPLETFDEHWLDRARRAGITHVLSFSPVRTSGSIGEDDIALRLAAPDPFLNPVWARGWNEPLYLYELSGSRGRAAFAEPRSGQSLELTSLTANEVVLTAQSSQPATVILTDLFYPGWQVLIDDQPAEALRHEGQFRAVRMPAGRHVIRWKYRPTAVFTGVILSSLSAILLLSSCFWRRRTAATEPA